MIFFKFFYLLHINKIMIKIIMVLAIVVKCRNKINFGYWKYLESIKKSVIKKVEFLRYLLPIMHYHFRVQVLYLMLKLLLVYTHSVLEYFQKVMILPFISILKSQIARR